MPPRDCNCRQNNNNDSSNPIDDMDQEEGNEDDDDSNFDDDMSYESEYDSEDDLDDAFGSFLMAAVHSQGEELRATRQAMVAALGASEQLSQSGPSPEARWKAFLANVASGESNVLKITDACYEFFDRDQSDLTTEVVTAIQSNSSLTHVILGSKCLARVHQSTLFQAISANRNTLTYVKLAPGQHELDVNALLRMLSTTMSLTELEVHNLDLSQQELQYFSGLLSSSSLKLIYLFGISVDTKSLDPLFRCLSTLAPLDELRVEGRHDCTVSPAALEMLLLHKQKWWRLSFDNLRINNEHCSVIARMFARSEGCKAGDLLSLESNPDITDAGFRAMFEVFYNKGRMGLIKVDNPLWVAEFDLVRSMNNLHGRLEVVRGGKIISTKGWIDWISNIGTQGWETENKRLNYIWFALRQNPEILE